MPQVSKYPVAGEMYDRCLELFSKALIAVRNPIDARHLITGLLTPTERIMLIKRIGIAMLLLKGYEYRSIQHILRVSFPTISLVNRSLTHGKRGYQQVLRTILQEEQFAQQLANILEKITGYLARGGKGSGTWRYLQQELKQKSRKRSLI